VRLFVFLSPVSCAAVFHCGSWFPFARAAEYIMAACHSLITINYKPVGDAMEKEALFASGWSLSREGTTLTKKGARARLQILRRFHFSSALKRMSVLVHEELVNGGGTKAQVLVKGAPEVIAEHLRAVPSGYEECYQRHSRAGKRVLALAHRVLKGASRSKLHNVTREEAESELEFAGFLVFECPIKPSSPDTIAQLRDSSHRVAMITGDNVLTAVHVASSLRMCTKPVLLLSLSPDPEDCSLRGTSVDGDTSLQFGAVRAVASALRHYDYALSGPEMSRVQLRAPRFARALFPLVKVFARVSPLQKVGVCVCVCVDVLLILPFLWFRFLSLFSHSHSHSLSLSQVCLLWKKHQHHVVGGTRLAGRALFGTFSCLLTQSDPLLCSCACLCLHCSASWLVYVCVWVCMCICVCVCVCVCVCMSTAMMLVGINHCHLA
jgi:Cation transport ATPase (P-type)